MLHSIALCSTCRLLQSTILILHSIMPFCCATPSRINQGGDKSLFVSTPRKAPRFSHQTLNINMLYECVMTLLTALRHAVKIQQINPPQMCRRPLDPVFMLGVFHNCWGLGGWDLDIRIELLGRLPKPTRSPQETIK